MFHADYTVHVHVHITVTELSFETHLDLDSGYKWP